MTKTDKDTIREVCVKLEALRLRIEKIKEESTTLASQVDTILSSERTKLDNMYDSFWETDRYKKMEAAADELENAKDSIEEIDITDITTTIESAKDSLYNALF